GPVVQTGPLLTANPYGRLLAAAAHPGTAPEALPHLLTHAPAKLLAVATLPAHPLTRSHAVAGTIPCRCTRLHALQHPVGLRLGDLAVGDELRHDIGASRLAGREHVFEIHALLAGDLHQRLAGIQLRVELLHRQAERLGGRRVQVCVIGGHHARAVRPARDRWCWLLRAGDASRQQSHCKHRDYEGAHPQEFLRLHHPASLLCTMWYEFLYLEVE